MEQSTLCYTGTFPKPWLLAYILQIFTLNKADILSSLKCAIAIFCSLSVHSNKIICLLFFFFLFCTLILNATINWEQAAALHTKDYCKTGTIPPHDTTSGKGLQSHRCQSARPPLELQTHTRRQTASASALWALHLVLVSDIIVVQTDPLVLKVLGLKSPCSQLRD